MTTTLGTLPHGELTAPRRERAPAASRTLRGVVDGVSLAVAVTVLALLQRTPGVVILGTLSAVVAFLALRELDWSRLGRRPPLRAELESVVSVASIVSLTVGAAGRAIGAHDDEVLATWLLIAGCLGLGRMLLRGLPARACEGTVLIAGTGKVAQQVAARLQAGYGPGLQPIGFVGDGIERREPAPALPVLGALWDLEQVIERSRPRYVVFASSLAVDADLIRLVHCCWNLDVEVFVVPRLYELQRYRSDLHHLGGVPLQPLLPARPRPWATRAKAVLDRVAAAAGLVALSPLLLVLAAGVRLSLGSPVLFRQTRVGRDGRHFEMLKFRTMRPPPEVAGEADASWAASIARTQTSGEPAPGESLARCTPFTRFLRRYSLDELPQLLNIIRGDMSWIGPRPERVHYVEVFEREVAGYADRHRVPVGLTGWAQVHGLRGETSLDDRVEWDNAYIDNWSPWLDLLILLRTIPAAVCSNRGPQRRARERSDP